MIENFYSELYCKREISRNKDYFLESYNTIKLNAEQKILNELIAVSEIVERIKKQKRRKTSRPDGLPTEYYRTFEECIYYHINKSWTKY